jgi:cytochrome c5
VSYTSRGFRRLSTLLVTISCALVAAAFFHADRNVIASSATISANSNAPAAKASDAKPAAAASQAAFLQVYKVLISPRCQNCHPSGDAPLQGDDSHVHIQNVKRGADGTA